MLPSKSGSISSICPAGCGGSWLTVNLYSGSFHARTSSAVDIVFLLFDELEARSVSTGAAHNRLLRQSSNRDRAAVKLCELRIAAYAIGKRLVIQGTLV